MEKLQGLKPIPAHSPGVIYPDSKRPIVPQNKYSEGEILKILSNKSPGLLGTSIGRYDLAPGGLRIDIRDSKGNLSCHFHPVPQTQGRPSSPVDTKNWQGDAEFIVHAEPIIRQLLEEIKELKKEHKL